MFRPFTFFCALLAGSSGMYLYTKKHQTTVLDQQISRIVGDTQHIRQQTAVLQTQWALLNQPDRLNHLAARFDSSLKPMEPKQFVRMSDLRQHLPSVESVHDAVVARADAPVAPTAPSESRSVAPVAMAANSAPEHDHVRDTVVKPAPSVVAETSVRKAPVVLAKADTPALPTHAHDARMTDAHTTTELRRLTGESPKPQTLALSDAPQAGAHKSQHHAASTASTSTDALALALGEKSETATVHHAAAHTVVADSGVTRHVATHEATDLTDTTHATHHAATTRVALGDAQRHSPAFSSPVTTVAAWRPAAAPRYVEARATYSGSLLGRSAIGGGLPPPMPVSN
ncbi:MAG: hypothetical protein ABF887_12315 [Gluconobacter oxydans]|uniref:Uncharacterized protein n=1 Tax=Acetobacter aceti TaxID=435 RepID=A0A1U9KE65_ACEAC|nr:hypothetical protein [Acetobacter aceti]AQS84072.1 hypothetical protein A0U92_04040 [Acetobacter aceti]